MAAPTVHSTHLSTSHTFSKTYTPSITLVQGVGVQNDCHSGSTNRHTSANPSAPNLRQVHLIPYELFTELAATQHIAIQPGELGENITTYGIDLAALSKGTYLYFGSGEHVPVVQITGTRWPGQGIERHRQGLASKLVSGGRSKAGVMGVVVSGGVVKAGDGIRIAEPQGMKVPLGPV